MKRKIVWLVVSCLMVLALLAASCAPAVEEAAPPEEKPAAPAVEVAPAEKPAAPIGPEMVKVSLKKLDGTVVEKMVEKPRYGGELILMRTGAAVGWDEGYPGMPGPIKSSVFATQERLLEGDWTRGPAGTGEVSWKYGATNDRSYQTGMLAESWEIVQPDTLIFHIRQGVRFGLNPALEASRLVGGREITADDIVWNLRRAYLELKSGHYWRSGASRPVDVYATDKWTVVLKAAPGQLWMTFDFVPVDGPVMYAPEVGKKWGDFNDWTRMVGTGPFLITDYVAMSQQTWVKNPNYWMKDPLFPANQLPYIDTLKVLIVPDASTRMSAMRTGRVDIDTTGTILWEDAASLQKTSPQLKYSTRAGSIGFLSGRQDKPELPFKDIRVRRALMMAINLQEMVDTYFGGNAEAFAFPVAPIPEWAGAFTPLEEIGLAPDGFDTKKLYTYHPAEAKKLLAAAGYPKGFKTEIVLNSPSVDQLSMVKDYWAKNLNVDLKLDVKETAVLAAMRTARTYKEMHFFDGYSLLTAYKYYEYRAGATTNFAMLDDPEIEERYKRLAAADLWSPEWYKVLKENNLYFIHRADYYPLPMPYVWVFWQPWVKGYQGETIVGSYGSGYQRYIWIDQALKKAMGR